MNGASRTENTQSNKAGGGKDFYSVNKEGEERDFLNEIYAHLPFPRSEKNFCRTNGEGEKENLRHEPYTKIRMADKEECSFLLPSGQEKIFCAELTHKSGKRGEKSRVPLL